MIHTLIGGAIPLAVALAFFGVLVTQIHAIPLWIVVGGGIVLMVTSLFEAVGSGEDQFGGDER